MSRRLSSFKARRMLTVENFFQLQVGGIVLAVIGVMVQQLCVARLKIFSDFADTGTSNEKLFNCNLPFSKNTVTFAVLPM